MSYMGRHPELKALEEFKEGKFTHAVDVETGTIWDIDSKGIFRCIVDYSKKEGFKSDVYWINEYNILIRVIFCKSFEHAVAVVEEMVSELGAGVTPALERLCNRYNIALPESYLADKKAKERAELDHRIRDLERQLEECRNERSALDSSDVMK